MSASPDVSIVIPCYNSERFLGETLGSVWAQTGVSYEVILIDDGSTDGTAERIRALGDRVRFEGLSHRGASAARNAGTRLARGRYLQYLDSDDLLVPGTLAARVTALERSGAGVAYTNWARLEEGPDGVFREGERICRRIEEVHPDPCIAIFTAFWAPPAAVMYARSVVDRIDGWNENLPVIQDARFMLDAALGGARFVHVPEIGALYRSSRAASLSNRNRTAFVRDVARNADEVAETWSRGGALDREKRRALLQVYGYVTRASFGVDRETFEGAYGRICSLDASYVPGPPHFRLVARILGYRNAERAARLYCRMKGGAVS